MDWFWKSKVDRTGGVELGPADRRPGAGVAGGGQEATGVERPTVMVEYGFISQ